jgi:hypothetical protein
MTRKMIAGIKVTYASIPAKLSGIPEASTGTAAEPAPTACVAGLPHFEQNIEPAEISLPQPLQKAITLSY